MLPSRMTDSTPWPRISIVTPSYNQGQYLEETIRSVLLQGYPNLEYLVIDGGSTDESVELLQRYDQWIAHWVTEPDRGQPHALNKGLARCTGDILGWINSDDLLLPEALSHLAVAAKKHPRAMILGNVVNCDEIRGYKWEMAQRNVSFDKMSQPWRYAVTWHQPGVYFPRTLFQRIGPMDESLPYVFDWDWMCDMTREKWTVD